MQKTMRLPKYVVILTLLLLLGCGDGNKAQINIRPEQVILRAEAVHYSGLSDAERKEISAYCCSYSRTGGWTSSDLVRFEPEEGYFARAVINADALAQLALLNSCGGATYVETCSADELTQKVTQILQNSNAHLLYGKYMSRWVFLAGEGEIPATVKFNGFDLLSIERQGSSPHLDHVLIGPIPERPTLMRIQLYHGATNENQELGSPEAVLSDPGLLP